MKQSLRKTHFICIRKVVQP